MPKKITSITLQKKAGRFNIFLDGEYAFPVSEDILIKYRLAKGQELDEALIAQLKQDDIVSKAYNKALDYLSYQLRSIKEMKTYLAKLEVTPEASEQVIKKLCDLNLLNDLNYAQSYVKTAMNTTDKGPYVITQKLKQKGIKDEFIASALELYTFERLVSTALKIADKFIAKETKLSFQAKKNKLYQRLLTKGFSSDVIEAVFEEVELKPNEEQEQQALARQAEKLLYRYRNLDKRERNFKLKQALYRKGFSLNEIDIYLQELD